MYDSVEQFTNYKLQDSQTTIITVGTCTCILLAVQYMAGFYFLHTDVAPSAVRSNVAEEFEAIQNFQKKLLVPESGVHMSDSALAC